MFAKRKLLNASLLIVLFSLLCAFISMRSAVGEGITEWQVEQKNHVSGVHMFYFTSKAIKIVCKSLGYQIIAKAPDWNVHAFRVDDKVVCKLSLQAFYMNRGFFPKHHMMENNTLVGTQTIGESKASVYRGKVQAIWVTKPKGIPVEVQDIILAYHQAPPVDGILLKVVKNAVNEPEKKDTSFFSMNERGAVVALETLQLKQIPYRASDFRLPEGLNTVSDIEQIITSASRRREAESILDELGIGERLGIPKGK